MMIDESTAIHAGLDMIVIVVVFIGLPSMLVIMTDLVQTVPRGSRTGGVVVNLTIVWPSIRTQPVEFFSLLLILEKIWHFCCDAAHNACCLPSTSTVACRVLFFIFY